MSTNMSSNRRRWMVWGSVVGLCAAVLIVSYLLLVGAPPPKRIVIATGGTTGAYYTTALKYAALLKEQGVTLDIRETKGSVENLQLLLDDNSGVDFAIVQSGVADKKVIERDMLIALGSLYREPLWVFHRADQPIKLLSDLEGKKVGIGPPGSGTYAIAMQLLEVNGLIVPDSPESAKVTLKTDSVDAAAEALQKGDLDAAFFVAAYDAKYIKELLGDDRVKLLSFTQHDAYHRRFRFLSEVTFPKGLVNLGKNLPKEDVSLMAPTAMLIARKNIHPALVPLFLDAATKIHGGGNELSNPGEFPSASFTDFPVSDEAKHYYKNGPPLLQRVLPFWLASLIDRLKIMLIPMLVLLMPIIRAAPPLAKWRTRRKIYTWYAALRDIDKKRVAGLSGPALDAELVNLREIEHQVSFVEVPLSYMDELYHLRMHVTMMQDKLKATQAEQNQTSGL